HRGPGVLQQVALVVTDDRVRDGDLGVGDDVHEDERFAGDVERYHLTAVDVGELFLGDCVEGLVNDLSRDDVLQLGTDERAALARLDVLELEDVPQNTVESQGRAVLDVVRRGHFGRLSQGLSNV